MTEGTPGKRKSRFVRAVSFLLLFVCLPCSGAAQVVQGHLYDAETGEHVSNGTVALRSGLGTVVARTDADSLGGYSLTAPGPGIYSLLATALGYESASTLQFEVGAEAPTTVDVRLEPEPIELDSLNVEAERQRIIPHLEKQGFYERAEEGLGEFIMPEEIERRNPRSFQDLLRGIPFLQVGPGGQLRWGPRCYRVTRRLWIDGILVEVDRDGRPTVLSQKISIDEIAAIEVYQSGAAMPLQYGGTEGHCAMLIWTKG